MQISSRLLSENEELPLAPEKNAEEKYKELHISGINWAFREDFDFFRMHKKIQRSCSQTLKVCQMRKKQNFKKEKKILLMCTNFPFIWRHYKGERK